MRPRVPSPNRPSANNQLATLADANNNLTTYVRDGFDRVSKIEFPDPTTHGVSSTTDYEQYGYDANSNVTSDRRRDGASFALSYDNLNRLTLADAPAGTDDVAYSYDLFGRQTQAQTASQTLTWGYDQLSRNISAVSPLGTLSYQYDLAGQRTRITWPDSFYAQYDYDLTGAVTAIRENGAASGAGVLATYAYDDYARRTSITRGNGVTTTYSYDSSTRLSSLAHDLASTGSDQTLSYSYNSGNQILSRTGSNSAYAWPQPSLGYLNYATNGLNQYPAVGGASFSYDSRGNLTSDGTTTYSYDAYNRLTAASGGATLGYDPASRLYQTAGAATTRFLYDGQEAIAEYNSSNALQRRYVFGPGMDEPIVWYEGSGTSDRRWLIANEQNSIIAVTDGSGAALNINSYDEYGQPASTNAGRFQFTGQMWLPEASLYNFKARDYSASLGRFMQTDPILFGGGLNIYGYVANDPVNGVDASGLDTAPAPDGGTSCTPDWFCPNGATTPEIDVTGGEGIYSDYGLSLVSCLLGCGNGGEGGGGERVCSPAEEAAKRLDEQYGPNAVTDTNERAAFAWGTNSPWTTGPVSVGGPEEISPPGISLPYGDYFMYWHSHPNGMYSADLSQADHGVSTEYSEMFGSNFAGMYLSAPSGLYGPPWTLAGSVTGTRNGVTVTEQVFSGTPVSCSG